MRNVLNHKFLLELLKGTYPNGDKRCLFVLNLFPLTVSKIQSYVFFLQPFQGFNANPVQMGLGYFFCLYYFMK